jgi:hypothetical protein
MTVQDLIDALSKITDKSIPVIREVLVDSGCSTCGPDLEDREITEVNDLETRVVLC